MQEHMYKVRPSSRTSPKDTFRIFLSAAQLSSNKFQAGDGCHIETSQGVTLPAIVWPAYEKIKDDVVQTSKALQVLYGLKLDSRISIRRGDVAITGANEINLLEISQNDSESSLPNVEKDDSVLWERLLRYLLCNAELLAPGMTFDHVEAIGEKKSFQIQEINSSTDLALYRAGPSCVVRLNDGHAEGASSFEHDKSLIVTSEGIGGLGKQIEQLTNEILTYSGPPGETSKFPYQGGILLHGIRGTGKSMVLGNICKAGWRRVFHIENTVGIQELAVIKTAIHQKITEALSCQPSVIIIDSLESIAGTKDPTDRAANVGDILSQELDRLDGAQTLVVGATRSLTEIDQNLRCAGRFDLEIELPIPDSKSRAEILKVLCAQPRDKAHSTIDSVAARTHGYVGADLNKLLRQARRTSRDQYSASKADTGAIHCRPTEPIPWLVPMEDAFNSAMRTIQPTAMYGIIVETPETKWSDIGGQYQAKRRIEQAVAWPLKVYCYRIITSSQ